MSKQQWPILFRGTVSHSCGICAADHVAPEPSAPTATTATAHRKRPLRGERITNSTAARCLGGRNGDQEAQHSHQEAGQAYPHC